MKFGASDVFADPAFVQAEASAKIRSYLLANNAEKNCFYAETSRFGLYRMRGNSILEMISHCKDIHQQSESPDGLLKSGNTNSTTKTSSSCTFEISTGPSKHSGDHCDAIRNYFLLKSFAVVH